MIYGFLYEPDEDECALETCYQYWEDSLLSDEYILYDTESNGRALSTRNRLFVKQTALELPIMYGGKLHEGKWLNGGRKPAAGGWRPTAS